MARKVNDSFINTVNEVRDALRAAGIKCNERVFVGRTEDCWGFWAPSFGVVLDPDLRGTALWKMLLHEFGHALGLDHTKKGLMHPHPLRTGVVARKPSRRQKEQWIEEIVEAVYEKRRRTLKGVIFHEKEERKVVEFIAKASK